MSKNNTYNKKQIDDVFENLIPDIDAIVNDINDYLLSYFKSSFDTKSFNNISWEPSKMNQNTLVDSGDLKKSIKTVSKNPTEIHIQSDTPYSAIHNYGGKIKITDKMRKFFWSQFYKTNNNSWKYMALTKRSHINIPERQFMGINNEIIKQIEQIITKNIK